MQFASLAVLVAALVGSAAALPQPNPVFAASQAAASPPPGAGSWSVNVWSGAGCSGTATTLAGKATSGATTCLNGGAKHITWGSGAIENAESCTFTFYTDGKCTAAAAITSTPGQCLNLSGANVHAMGVHCA